VADKFERLVNLMGTLLQTRIPLTIEEIRTTVSGYGDIENFDSFRRTFERDKLDLKEMGAEVVLLNVDFGEAGQQGYRILPQDHYLADPGLEPDELAALQLAIETVRLDQETASLGLRHLGGREMTAVSTDLDADLPNSPHLGAATDAVRRQRTLGFRYGGVDRVVEPYRVGLIDGRWYLGGWDRLRDAHRTFRVDRIEGALTVGNDHEFEPPEVANQLRLDPWRFGDGEPVRTSVHFDRGHVERAMAEFGSGTVWTLQDDGGVVGELDVTSPDAFRSVVLSFGDHAEVTDPPEVRADIIGFLTGTTR